MRLMANEHWSTTSGDKELSGFIGTTSASDLFGQVKLQLLSFVKPWRHQIVCCFMEGTASAYDWVFYFQSKIPLRLWASIAWSYTLLLKPPVLMCFAPCFIDKSKVRHTLFTSIHDKQSSKPHQATQSQFPVSGPTSHLKMTRPPG